MTLPGHLLGESPGPLSFSAVQTQGKSLPIFCLELNKEGEPVLTWTPGFFREKPLSQLLVVFSGADTLLGPSREQTS